MLSKLLLLLAFLAGNVPTTKAKMRDLSGLVGTWDAHTSFDEVGTYTISWALDSTYLQWHLALGKRSMMIMLTYNPDSARYESTYFYNRSSLRVFETGAYDPAAHEFRTEAFIPREDGVRDEHVRTITKFFGDTAITYTHFSRYSDQAAERNDFSATLRRATRRP
jgi:hypothetical protein